MDIRKVKKLIELLEESNVAVLEIHEGVESVRISRLSAALPAQAAPAVAAPPPVATAAPQEAAVVEPAAPEGHAVTSPMVGTFYEAASPGAKPFVQVGQQVKSESAAIDEADLSLKMVTG